MISFVYFCIVHERIDYRNEKEKKTENDRQEGIQQDEEEEVKKRREKSLDLVTLASCL